jgi:hypothetical protein
MKDKILKNIMYTVESKEVNLCMQNIDMYTLLNSVIFTGKMNLEINGKISILITDTNTYKKLKRVTK